MGRPRVVLNMIVRDEGAVIERCLERVKPHIDAWVIVDTGSTDDTKDKIRKTLGDLPGELHDLPWKNHGDSRNDALELARKAELGDYFLFVDADDTWEPDASFAWPEKMSADGYLVQIRQRSTIFRRVIVAKATHPWHYMGTAHAVLTCSGPHVLNPLDGVCIHMHSDGARRASADPIQKYRDDAAAFEKQLAEDPGSRRAMFYLAQSYRDSGETEKAARWYRRRAVAGGWDEEVFCAKLEFARLQDKLAAPFEEVRDAFIDAHRARPLRAEPLLALSQIHHRKGDNAGAFLYAAAAKDLPLPSTDILFVDAECYEWRALDTFAMAAWRIGARELATVGNQALLLRPRLPDSQRPRINRNLRWCRPPPTHSIEESEDAVLESLCITLLTGRRLDLLRRTVESLPEKVRQKAHVIVFLNGRDEETKAYLDDLAFVDELVYEPTDEPASIGAAATRLATSAIRSGRPLVLHLEDDWECTASGADFFVQAATILRNPHVGQVRLRLASERCLSKHMVTGKPYKWDAQVIEGVKCKASDVHFTFNPSLMRTADLSSVFPATHEIQAARNFMMQGWRVAQLPGAFRHIGGGESLRIAMHR